MGQLRLGTGWETWTPSQEDIKLLKDAEANISKGLWEDQQGDPAGEEEAALLDEEIFNFRPIQERANTMPPLEQPEEQDQQAAADTPMSTPRHDAVQPLDLASFPGGLHQQLPSSPHQPMTTPDQPAETPPPLPPEVQHYTQQQQNTMQQQYMQQQQQTNIYQDRRTININVDSPTHQQFQQFGQANFGAVPRTPRNRPRSRTPSRAPADEAKPKQRPAIDNTTEQPNLPLQLDQTTNQEQAQLEPLPQAASEPLPQLPMKRAASTPAEALITKFQHFDDGSMAPTPLT